MDLLFSDLDVHIASKQILDKVCGSVKQGEMLAVMGESGAGKSTLLNALAGRLNISKGSVTYNNQPFTKWMKRKIAYVLQEDIFFPKLTLKETLTYNALLRLPEKMPLLLKLQKVEEMIEILELKKCANTIIGDGLSGGEKKRTSIAIELLINPLILLIDEPTSGLDSSVAYLVMKTLKNYTEKMHMTVVTTIHQPSSQIFHMYKQLLLLHSGKVAYFGTTTNVLDFFSQIDMYCEPQYNPADFILEKMTENAESTNKIMQHCALQRLSTLHRVVNIGSSDINSSSENNTLEDRLSFNNNQCIHDDAYSNINNGYILNACQTDIESNTGIVGRRPNRQNSIVDSAINQFSNRNCKWPTGFKTQFTVLLKRSFKDSIHRYLSAKKLFELFLVKVLMAIIWFQVPRKEENINVITVYIFLLVAHLGFMYTFSGALAFDAGRKLISRERAAGVYRLSAYYLSTITTNAILSGIICIIYYAPLYWIVGFAPHFHIFLASLSVMLLCGLAFQGVGCMLGICILDFPLCASMCTTLMIWYLFLAEFVRPVLPTGLFWLRYVSILNYGYKAILALELTYGNHFQCSSVNQTLFIDCKSEMNNTDVSISGESILLSLHNTSSIWIHLVILLGITVVSLLSGYLVLRFVLKS